MTFNTAYAPVELKSIGDGGVTPQGRFTALVSVFNTIDMGGDRVMPGAFGKSVDEWAKGERPLPVYWNHDHDDPFSNIGVVKSMQETPQGLVVDAQLDMDNPKAAQVFNLMAQKRIDQFSFAYSVPQGGYSMKSDGSGGSYRQLNDVNLLEVGPCWRGMNPDTRLLGTKSDETGEATEAVSVDTEPDKAETPPGELNPFKNGFDPSQLKELVRGFVRDELHASVPGDQSDRKKQTAGKSHGQLDSWIALQGMIGESHEITA